LIEYTQTELRIMGVFSVLGAVFSWLIGGMDNIIAALLVLIVADYITGLIAAWRTNALNSRKGFNGIWRKIVMLIMVVVAHQIDVILSDGHALRSMVVFAYIGNEGLSIMENVDRMGCGGYIPNVIRDRLIQLQTEKGGAENVKSMP